MPRPAERVRGDGCGGTTDGERCCATNNSGRTLEIGRTCLCQQLAEEMEGNHADTKIGFCADGLYFSGFVYGTVLDSGKRDAPMVSI